MTDLTNLTGPELDRAVAVEVMGWEWENGSAKVPVATDPGWVATSWFKFRPSADIAHAWRVVDRVGGMLFSKRAAFSHALRSMFPVGASYRAWPDAIFALRPEHICQAALSAVRS
jgi:hypothetical protein